MKLRLERSGGFAAMPGLSRDVVVDSAQLPQASSSRLQHLVTAAGVERQPRVRSPHPGAADMITFRLTVDDGGQQQILEFTDPIGDPALDALVAFLSEIDHL